MNPGLIFTFYSYKGGVGRTFVLANVAAVLARWGLRVLCVDWDLEAPGLHLYFKKLLDPPAPLTGLLDVIEAHRAGAPLPWRDHLRKAVLADATHPIDLLCAGAGDDRYEGRVQAIRWEDLFARHELGVALEQMRAEWCESYDLVLVDSRTGITDLGGICTILLPDILVLLGTANRQSIDGLRRVAELAERNRDRLPVDRGLLRVLPVLTRFEGRVEVERSQSWLKEFQGAFDPLVRRWISEGSSAPDLLNRVRIPHVAYWSFGEDLAVVEEGTHDPEGVGYALETLAALLQHGLDDADRLLGSRESYVAESADAHNPFPWDLLILHTTAEAGRAAELAGLLGGQGLKVVPQLLSAQLLTEGFSHFRNVVVMAGGRVQPREAENISHYVRRFFSERPQVGRLVPLLGEQVKLPSLADFAPVILDGRALWQVAEELVGRLSLVRQARARRVNPEMNPALWSSVSIQVDASSDGFHLDGDQTVSASDQGLQFTPADPDAYRLEIPWRDIIGATWVWTENVWLGSDRYDKLCLLLRFSDPVGVVSFHEVWLTSHSNYEIQRLRRQIEAAMNWPRVDPPDPPKAS